MSNYEKQKEFKFLSVENNTQSIMRDPDRMPKTKERVSMTKHEKKKGFILYHNYGAQLDILTDEQAGQFIKGIFAYVNTGVRPQFQEPIVAMLFSIVADQLDRDTEKYEHTCRVRSEAGKKGGRPRKNREAEQPETFETQEHETYELYEPKPIYDCENQYETEIEEGRQTSMADGEIPWWLTC